jgi:hypothetical protein
MIDKGLRLKQWQYWILFQLSQSEHGSLSLSELRPLVFERMKPNLTEKDNEPTKESKGKPRKDTALRAALYWGKNSLKARKLILNIERSEIYEITAEGREHLRTHREPPSSEIDGDFA